MRVWGTVGAAVALMQAGLLFPFLVSAGRETGHPPEGRTLTILSANLECTNRQADEVFEEIRRAGADIVALQEVGPWWAKKLATLEEYPYRIIDHSTSRPGVALLSRIQPGREVWTPLLGRNMLTVPFGKGERNLSVTVLHTLPPRTPFLYGVRNRQIDLVATRIQRSEGPLIVAGDLNATPWSPVLRDFEEKTGLGSVRNGRGPLPTWPSWNSLLRVPIDHIYTSPILIPEEVDRIVIPGSDHAGLLARIRLP
jgi:endonuclease/exonuclease/phosphatase (EEP) superfamily protein YafD